MNSLYNKNKTDFFVIVPKITISTCLNLVFLFNNKFVDGKLNENDIIEIKDDIDYSRLLENMGGNIRINIMKMHIYKGLLGFIDSFDALKIALILPKYLMIFRQNSLQKNLIIRINELNRKNYKNIAELYAFYSKKKNIDNSELIKLINKFGCLNYSNVQKIEYTNNILNFLHVQKRGEKDINVNNYKDQLPGELKNLIIFI